MVDAWLLHDLDVLGIGVRWMVIVACETSRLDHKVGVLGVSTGNGILEGGLTRLALLRVKIFDFKVWLAVHAIDAAGLLCSFLLVKLLIELHVFEQLVLALLVVGAL